MFVKYRYSFMANSLLKIQITAKMLVLLHSCIDNKSDPNEGGQAEEMDWLQINEHGCLHTYTYSPR